MSRMHLQNRVLPTGEIVSAPFRGTLTGNRGILPFDASGQLGTSRWKHQHWIICTLTHPRGRYHGPQPARGWTPLFFLNEAVALAAGHRPCAYCRPQAYRAWQRAWIDAHGDPSGHKEMDAALHAARVTRNRQQIRYFAGLRDLPDYTFVLFQEHPHMVLGQHLVPFAPDGNADPLLRHKVDDLQVEVLTPGPTVAVLASGYRPDVPEAR
ncbi:hypothetical protein [Roseibium sp. MMSF_3544]|uniref:hypothetical protein n=1 Tax=unclassified Roseibium TaxID=2629323 RepID=UPI00273F52FA|nr:hypothetical protein [Roseibium sp. MMSF_3544]